MYKCIKCIKATSNRTMLLHCVLLGLEQNWFTAMEDRKQITYHSCYGSIHRTAKNRASIKKPPKNLSFTYTSRISYYFNSEIPTPRLLL